MSPLTKEEISHTITQYSRLSCLKEDYIVWNIRLAQTFTETWFHIFQAVQTRSTQWLSLNLSAVSHNKNKYDLLVYLFSPYIEKIILKWPWYFIHKIKLLTIVYVLLLWDCLRRSTDRKFCHDARLFTLCEHITETRKWKHVTAILSIIQGLISTLYSWVRLTPEHGSP